MNELGGTGQVPNRQEIRIDLHALRHNFERIEALVQSQEASWTVVTKALCGHAELLSALGLLGMRSAADSRLDNLRVLRRVNADCERWFLRLPQLSRVTEVIELASLSLNSELRVIEALSREALRRERVHRVIVMIELGDLREGALPGALLRFFERVLQLPAIEIAGIGAQLGCLSGALPNVDQLAQLLLYHELLELKFERPLPILSAGSSNFLPLLMAGKVPKGLNHYRIGEALFLGTDLVNGGTLEGFRDDVFELRAEISEIKEKSLLPVGELGHSTPFEPIGQDNEAAQPGQRGFRAIVNIGQLDTEVAGLTPLDPRQQLAGASSDMSVVNLGDSAPELKLGDCLRFRPNYGALVRLMTGQYIAKTLSPSLERFAAELDAQQMPQAV
ncbi:MAG: alanine racemase [Myxococcota bacterium]|jgi:predicted amino acid racemase|nr:alanine racemase [Myxococcota bacterium]